MHIRRRHLPHIEVPGGTYSIAFALKDRRICDLSRPDIAPIIVGALHSFHGNKYILYDYTVMPDHVHVILKPLDRDGKYLTLGQILHSIKGWTANEINAILGRKGHLWQPDRHDRLILNVPHYRAQAQYIWNNPVAAGLVADPADWPWTGCGPDLPVSPPPADEKHADQ